MVGLHLGVAVPFAAGAVVELDEAGAVREINGRFNWLPLDYLTFIYSCFESQVWHTKLVTLEQLKEEANELSDEQKGRLASDLLASMAPPSYDVSDEEVIERIRQLESGEVADISFGELKKRMGR